MFLSSEQMRSKVGFCCVYSVPALAQVAETELYRYFSGFGAVKEIYIFQNQPITKAFIEFDSAESLDAALHKSNRMQTAFGKIKLFRSYKSNIDAELKQKVLKQKLARFGGHETAIFSKSNSERAEYRPEFSLDQIPGSYSSTNSEKVTKQILENLQEKHPASLIHLVSGQLKSSPRQFSSNGSTLTRLWQ